MLLPEAQLPFQALFYYSSSAALASSDSRIHIPVTSSADKRTRGDSAETKARTRETTVTVAFGGMNDQEAADRIDDASEKYCNTAEDINSRQRVTEVDKRWLAVPGTENRTGTDSSSGTGTAVRNNLAAVTTEDIQ